MDEEKYKETAVVDQSGRVLAIECDGVSAPAGYGFAAVNDWVHDTDRQYEELQWHALGAANEHDKLSSENDRLKTAISSEFEDKFHVFERLQDRLESGCNISFDDGTWNLFDAAGELVCYGQTVRQMLVNLIFVDC